MTACPAWENSTLHKMKHEDLPAPPLSVLRKAKLEIPVIV